MRLWGYTRCPESLYRTMRKLGLFPTAKPTKKYEAKPYELMTHAGERIQVDIKGVPRRCMADLALKLYQYTAIDEYSRLRFLGAYPEQSTYSSADFITHAVEWFRRRGVLVERVQTDNGFEFTNRFSNSKRDIPDAIRSYVGCPRQLSVVPIDFCSLRWSNSRKHTVRTLSEPYNNSQGSSILR